MTSASQVIQCSIFSHPDVSFDIVIHFVHSEIITVYNVCERYGKNRTRKTRALVSDLHGKISFLLR